MLETIAAYIEKYQLFPAQGEIIVAVSGGADSLCLLHLLNRLCGPDRRYPRLRLHVAHLNHKLRGEASDQDAHKIEELVRSWGLPITLGERDVLTIAKVEHRSLEDAARSARYNFLRGVAQGSPIVVAHHAEDQVETLLLHWLRGGGLASQIGMQPRQQEIVRPLLETHRADILDYCAGYGLVPLEDASNTDTRFLRNRIRHELLPMLESLNPGIRGTLLRNAEVVKVDYDWLETQVETHWPRVVIEERPLSIRLNRQGLQGLPLSLQRHLWRKVTARLCKGQSPLELRHYLLLEELVERPLSLEQQSEGRGRSLDLPAQLRVVCRATEVLCEQVIAPTQLDIIFSSNRSKQVNEPQEASLALHGRVEIPGTNWGALAEPLSTRLTEVVRLVLQQEGWKGVWRILPTSRNSVYIDGDKVESLIRIRTRRPGDRIRPLGMEHSKKIQDIMVDRHVPREERATVPLFFSGETCIWLAGICIDGRVALGSTTKKIVRLALIKKSP
ncbi:MAG TPA: tRNA lysidine(34) synthetase TilS [Ktedonobacteraceae bacterium]|nr:tRNA lysidine(34) synthetase TilS [Ktedonobacteraceae bacterium]